jgi:RNA polymerase sigma-70 factor (ECF subfamily)
VTACDPVAAGRIVAGGAGICFPQPRAAGFFFSRRNRSGMNARMEGKVSIAGSQSREPAELLVAIGRGDKAALSRLYRLTSSRLYGICLHMLRNEAEAEDVLQEVYVTVWRKASLFDAAKASGQTWLGVLARNKAVDRLRRRQLPTAPVEQAEQIADDGPSALDVIEAAEDGERLSHCLDELEERQRGLIRTAFFEGVTYSDLATREEVPLGTMKSWIRRGLMRLKGCLER